MEVILKTDVYKLGNALDIVKVKDGYARNFLFPRKLAVQATASSKEMVLKNRAKMEAIFLKERTDAQATAKKLEQVSVTISRKVHEEERLYGSVNPSDIADALKSQGYKIEKRQIELESPIKQLGVFTAKIKMVANVEARIKVWVVKEE